VANAAAQIMLTNNVGNSRTNLKIHLDAYKFKAWHVVAYGTNTNDVVYYAGTNELLSLAVGVGWATVTYFTNTVYASDFVLMPPNTSQSNSFLIWQMSALATNLQKSTSSIGNLKLTNTVATNFTVYGFSSPGSGASSFSIGQDATATAISSTTVGNQATNSSTFAVVIGDAATAVGSQWAVVLGKSALATNSQHSVTVGATAYVSNAFGSTVLGKGANAKAIDSVALGRLATIGVDHSNSVALGVSAATTTNFQIRLGRSTETVSIPGQLDVTQTSYLARAEATNLNAQTATLTNASGAFSGLTATSLVAHAASLTNAAGRFLASYALNWILDGPTVTNLSAPGPGANSQQIGASAIAAGENSVAFGVSSVASNNSSIALGVAAVSTNDLGIAIGAHSLAGGYGSIALGSFFDDGALGTDAISIGLGTTAHGEESVALGPNSTADYDNSAGFLGSSSEANQIRLGTSSMTVDAPGRLHAGTFTNSVLSGSNIFTGSIRLISTNATGMASGDVLLNIAPDVNSVVLSGHGAAMNVCGVKNGSEGRRLRFMSTAGYNIVIRHLSGAAGTAASERIYTKTGADVTITGTTIVTFQLTYYSTLSAWVLDWN
jgi:trimeric autotransporter adhesin